MTTRVVDREGLDALLAGLTADGYTVIGPTVRDQAIVYDRIESTDDLPEGVTDDQEGGRYRLLSRDDAALFGYNLGQDSWKRILYPPHTDLVRITRADGTLVFSEIDHQPEPKALFGVRACELAAIAVQDRVFLRSGPVDRTYAGCRDGIFVVAVNCGTAGGTCFCVSMDTGPECTSGFDIVATELLDGPDPAYLLESGSPRGAAVVAALPGRDATEDDRGRAAAVVESTAARMGRTMDTDGIRDLLVDHPDHPRWEEVADRCLTCGNCTLACPTCFCSTTSDTVGLDGEAVRSRRWDSCFGLDFSALHGHPVRSTNRERYRQWMTHKLATWYDQFGSSGCVGCGRCITWCPVGIDITEEVAAMRATVPT